MITEIQQRFVIDCRAPTENKSPKHQEKIYMGDIFFWAIATLALIVGFRWLQKRKK